EDVDLFLAEVRGPRKDQGAQVLSFNLLRIVCRYVSDTRAGQVDGNGASDAPRAGDVDAGLAQPLLALPAKNRKLGGVTPEVAIGFSAFVSHARDNLHVELPQFRPKDKAEGPRQLHSSSRGSSDRSAELAFAKQLGCEAE